MQPWPGLGQRCERDGWHVRHERGVVSMRSEHVPALVGVMLGDPVERRRIHDFLLQSGVEVLMNSHPDDTQSTVFASPSVSMIIVDEWAAHRHSDALFKLKQSMHPLALPLLLLVPEKAMVRAYLRAGFDDVLRFQLPHDELQARLEVHLRLRQQSELAMYESESRFNTTFNMAPVGIAYMALDGHFKQSNLKFTAALGYPPGALDQMHFSSITASADMALMEREIAVLGSLSRQAAATFECHYVRLDQSLVWVSLNIGLHLDCTGQPSYFIVVAEDISLRKSAELALRETERLAQATMDAMGTHICVLDSAGTILAINQAWRNFGSANGAHASDIAEGINYLDVCDKTSGAAASSAAAVAAGIRDVLAGVRLEFSTEYGCHSATEQRWFYLKVSRFPDGGPTRAVITHSDISERQLAARHLLHLAHHDTLTSLPNRLLIDDRLAHALARADRNHWSVAVLFLDLDHFKLVNDTQGHAAGDLLLKEVSRRLLLCLGSGDTIGRLGGDEFIVLLPDLVRADDAALVAQKLMEAFLEPVALECMEVFVTASIGISLYRNDGANSEQLIKNADTAMYMAKELGRNNIQFYVDEMNTQALTRMTLGNSLRRALERQEFYLDYQPQYDLQSARMIGTEALIRWNHPGLGIVSPVEFIPIAEENGLIVSIGEWVMRTACAQNKAWQDAGLPPVTVAVNMSARQLARSDVVDTVRRVLAETALEGRYLELELTEGMMMDKAKETIGTLHSLKALGVHISIDDFGTGYSNLGYLERFPLDTLKIDKSFIQRIDDADTPGGMHDKGAIARAVINLGHSLGFLVIAEGVETAAQLSYLRACGCNSIQGYYFSRPVAPGRIAELLVANHTGNVAMTDTS